MWKETKNVIIQRSLLDLGKWKKEYYDEERGKIAYKQRES